MMPHNPQTDAAETQEDMPQHRLADVAAAPLPNYTLATVCPACTADTYRHACKVRCPRCGFMWDCSEL